MLEFQGNSPGSSVLPLWKTRPVTPLCHRNCWHLLLCQMPTWTFCSAVPPVNRQHTAHYGHALKHISVRFVPVSSGTSASAPAAGSRRCSLPWTFSLSSEAPVVAVQSCPEGLLPPGNCCHFLLESTAACATTWPCWGRPAAGSTSRAAGPWVRMSTRVRVRARTRARETERMRAGTRHKADEVALFSGCGQEPPRWRQGRTVLPTRDELLLPERVRQL